MSQDIRSFFVKTPKGSTKKPEETIKGHPVPKKRNKKRVLDSDDDDDDDELKTKIHKNNRGSPKKVKTKSDVCTSNYFEVSKNDISSLLGKHPVKRVQQVVKEKVEYKIGNIDLDIDVTSAFLKDDDDDWFNNLNSKQNGDECIKSPKREEVQNKGNKKNKKVKLERKSVSKSPDKHERSVLKSPVKPKRLASTSPVKPKRLASTSPVKPKRLASTSPVKSESFESKSPVKSESFESKSPVKPKSLESNSQVNKRERSVSKSPVKPQNSSSKLNSLLTKSADKKRKGSDTIEFKAKKLEESPNSNLSPCSSIIKLARFEVKSNQKQSGGSPEKISRTEEESLWVERYKPSSVKQIIGQQGPKSNVNKLIAWLNAWSSNHASNKKLTKPAPWAKDDSGSYFKAALLSGPPGVGKTTTAHLVCRELGFDMVEFNASDTRSKKMLGQEVSELLTSKSLSQFAQGGGEVSKKRVLVMDEVDGMAGNEDRGGVQELIQLIKTSKIPIICMCNDRNHPKIRSLANHCFDLRFSKPRLDQIKGAMMSICFKEKLKIKPEALAEIISSTNQDIRLVLNYLSMLAARKEDNMSVTSKHIKLGPWDVTRKVFSEEEHKSMTFFDKSDLFFHDYSVAPLFVHENYLIVSPHSKAASSKQGKMELFGKVATSLATGDLIESSIRSRNAWSLLPVQAMFSSVIPGELLEGHVGGMIAFPSWFGKNSRRSKLDRFAQEIQSHTRLRISGCKQSVVEDYGRSLRDWVLGPLATEGAEGVETSLSRLRHYDLLREDLEALTELTSWPGITDPNSGIESKVKAGFTRAYNKAPVMTPFSTHAPVKKGRKGGNSEEWGEEDEEEDPEEDSEDPTTDAMIMVKKRNDKKAEKKVTKKNEASSSKPRGGKRSKK